MKLDGRIEDFISPQEFIETHGLGLYGKVQKRIDSAIIRYTDPYVPFDSGTLARSVNLATAIGSGRIIYDTPYAQRMYYNPQFNFNKEIHSLAGGEWFERAMADHKDDILKEAKAVCE